MSSLQFIFVVGVATALLLSPVNVVLHHIMIARINRKSPGRLSHFSFEKNRPKWGQVVREYNSEFPGNRVAKVAQVLSLAIISIFALVVFAVLIMAIGAQR